MPKDLARARDRVVAGVVEAVVVDRVHPDFAGERAKRERLLGRAVVAGLPGEVTERKRLGGLGVAVGGVADAPRDIPAVPRAALNCTLSAHARRGKFLRLGAG